MPCARRFPSTVLVRHTRTAAKTARASRHRAASLWNSWPRVLCEPDGALCFWSRSKKGEACHVAFLLCWFESDKTPMVSSLSHCLFSADLQFQSGLFVFMKRLDLVVMHTTEPIFIWFLFVYHQVLACLFWKYCYLLYLIVHFCSYLIYAKKKSFEKNSSFFKK